MALAWFFYTFIPLVFLYDVPINPLPIFYIATCIFAFSLSALPFNWNKAFHANKLKTIEDSSRLDGKLIRYLFFISVICAIFFTTRVVQVAGFDLTSIVTDLRSVSTRFASVRAQGKLYYDISGILSIFFTYLTPILGGLTLYRYPHRMRKIVFIAIAFLPPTYFMLVQSTKLVVFYSIGMYAAAFLLRKVQSGSLNLFNKNIILKIIIAFILFIPFLIFTFATRNDYTKLNDIINASLHSFQSYAFAQIYAFADYISFYLGMDSASKYQHDFNSYGSYTFTSIYNSFGRVKSFPTGTYYDYYYYKKQLATNIFTIFRGLVNDFGFIGTIIFMFFSGLVAHAFYYRMLIARNSRISSSVFIITVVYIEGTYLASIFMARYMYLIFAALVVIFWLNDKYEENISGQKKFVENLSQETHSTSFK